MLSKYIIYFFLPLQPNIDTLHYQNLHISGEVTEFLSSRKFTFQTGAVPLGIPTSLQVDQFNRVLFHDRCGIRHKSDLFYCRWRQQFWK